MITVCLFAVASAMAAVVTVDIASKKIESDSPIFESRIMKIVGKQMSIKVWSSSFEPQKFTLKVIGLEPGDQDLYINGKYISKKPDTAFAGGFEISVPGRSLNVDQLRCIESSRDRVKAEVKRLEPLKGDEPLRVLATMRQADSWILSVTQADKFMRAVDVIIAPADLVLQLQGRSTVKSKEEVAKTLDINCELLHQARSRMYNVIKEPALRNISVIALTPVDFKASYFVSNGKTKADGKVINNSDLPISGKINIVLPAGWKANAKNLTFKDLAPGKSYSVPFALVPPKQGEYPPAGITLSVNVKIGTEPLLAKFKLESVVVLGSSNTVPVVPKPEVIPAPAPVVPSAVGGM